MTSTEVQVDPLGHVAVGQNAPYYGGYDSTKYGIYSHSDYAWCATLGPYGNPCTRPGGHPVEWVHVACSPTGDHLLQEIWRDGSDPNAHLIAGSTPADTSKWIDPIAGVWSERSSAWCRSPHHDRGVCSRPIGHPVQWSHISAKSDRVLAVWGATGQPVADRFGHLQRGDYASDVATWTSADGARVARDLRCTVNHHSYTTSCTRKAGHLTVHLSCNDSGQIMWSLPNIAVGSGSVAAPDVDPEDGTPTDSEDTVCSEAPSVGAVVRLRDRSNRLYVLGSRRATPEVEVLDLTRNELRAIPIVMCIPVEEQLTVEELGRVARWYADHRDRVRKVAVREYVADRWCMDGLNTNLRSMGLERYEPTLRGVLTMRIPFETPDLTLTQSQIVTAVDAALNADALTMLRAALPKVDAIALDLTALTVRATDFVRK